MSSYFRLIPAHICDDPNLTDSEKLFYGLVVSLTNKMGFCFASNRYLAKEARCSERKVQRMLHNLHEQKHFIIEIEHGYERRIWLPETYVQKDRIKKIYNEEFNQRFTGDDKVAEGGRQSCGGGDDTDGGHISKAYKEKAISKDIAKKAVVDSCPTILLTEKQIDQLYTEFGKDEVNAKVERMYAWCTEHKKTFQNWYKELKAWLVKDTKETKTYIAKHRAIAEKLDALKSKQITLGHNYLEFNNGMAVTHVKFSDAAFIEIVTSELRKRKIREDVIKSLIQLE